MAWKSHIRTELQKRDRNQKVGYEGLLETHLKLLDRLDLQNFLADKLQLELHRNDLKISKQAHDISSLTRRCLEQEAYVEELERQYQLLQDEHSVLQLTYMSLDEKRQRTESENKELVAQWMEEKALEADRLNRCNEEEEMYGRLLAKFRRKLEKRKRSAARSSAHAPEQPATDQQRDTSEDSYVDLQDLCEYHDPVGADIGSPSNDELIPDCLPCRAPFEEEEPTSVLHRGTLSQQDKDVGINPCEISSVCN
ncbi:autophagy-related protein 16-like isoform X2 [Ambystoma mexicanum]|uniref:autophagy-related protein 16-like isoform X2 n=1 Tax=Ambystoma mexicanum TaxID=8296 RepID=UPI0037E9B911